MLENPGWNLCGGADVFSRLFNGFAKIYTRFREISPKNESSDHGEHGNRVQTPSEEVDCQKSVFFAFKFPFLTQITISQRRWIQKSILDKIEILEMAENAKQKSCELFSDFSGEFFFSMANNSKTRGDRAILSKKLAV